MKLIAATGFVATAVPGVLDCVITLDNEDGTTTGPIPYTYSPSDPFGAATLIKAFIVANNPPVAPYVAPVVDLNAIDLAALNDALTAPGTVTRALGLVVFDLATGKIPIKASYTMAQYLALLQAKMR